MPAKKEEHVCFKEKQIGKHENDITELKVRSGFREDQIKELNENMKNINDKLDSIKDDIQKIQHQSQKGDSSISDRVTALENTVKVLKWVSVTSISFLGVFIAVLSFTILHIH